MSSPSNSRPPQPGSPSNPRPQSKAASRPRRKSVRIDPIPRPETPKQRQRRFVLSGVAAVLLLGGGFYYWNHRAGTISGHVKDAAGAQSLTNAHITLDEQTAAQINSTTQLFALNQVAPGPHHLLIEAPGYAPRTVDVDLAPGAEQSLELTLDPLAIEDPFDGQLIVVGTRNTDGLEVHDASFRLLYQMSLETWPYDGVAAGSSLFVSLNTSDRIDRLELRERKVTGSIQLPKLSGPTRLLITPDHRQLLILNMVAQNLTVADVQTLQIVRTIPLPVGITDMVLSADGLYVFGIGPTNQLLKITYSNGFIDTPHPVEVNVDVGIKVRPGLGDLIVPIFNHLTLVGAASGSEDDMSFDQQITQFAAIDANQLLLGEGNKLLVYNLAQHQQVGEAYAFPAGCTIRKILQDRDHWLVATENPVGLYSFSLQNLKQPAAKVDIKGQVQFLITHHM